METSKNMNDLINKLSNLTGLQVNKVEAYVNSMLNDAKFKTYEDLCDSLNEKYAGKWYLDKDDSCDDFQLIHIDKIVVSRPDSGLRIQGRSYTWEIDDYCGYSFSFDEDDYNYISNFFATAPFDYEGFEKCIIDDAQAKTIINYCLEKFQSRIDE